MLPPPPRSPLFPYTTLFRSPEVLAGTMVAYFDIFPFARRLEFTHEQETWVIDDQYCCNPKCPCQEAVLSFIRPPQGAERGPLRPTLSISYRYRDGKVSRLDAEKNARYSEQGLRSEEHTSELQSHSDLVCRLLLEKKKKEKQKRYTKC